MEIHKRCYSRKNQNPLKDMELYTGAGERKWRYRGYLVEVEEDIGKPTIAGYCLLQKNTTYLVSKGVDRKKKKEVTKKEKKKELKKSSVVRKRASPEAPERVPHRYWSINDIAVDPYYRGIGKELMCSVIGEIGEFNEENVENYWYNQHKKYSELRLRYSELRLETGEKWEKARHFYTQLGFHQCGKWNNYYADNQNAIRMKLCLYDTHNTSYKIQNTTQD